MSRHNGGGTDGAYGDGTWLPGGYGGQADDGSKVRQPAGRRSGAHRRPEGSTQTSEGSDSQTGPPWEEASPPWEPPAWDDTGISQPRLDPADLAGRHPSAPLPSQPLHEGDWPEAPSELSYAGQEPGGRHTVGDQETPATTPATGTAPDTSPAATRKRATVPATTTRAQASR